jgi:hypothetical protein
MSYDEIEIEDMAWNEELQAFTYPCPCGDLFQITIVSELRLMFSFGSPMVGTVSMHMIISV